jgi:hypothetical protein
MLKSKSQTIRKSAPAYEAGRKEKRQPVEREERFGGLDLERYRETIEADQFDLLLEFVGVDPARADFDPSELFYPEGE